MRIYVEDCRKTMLRLPSRSVDAIVASPPFFHGMKGDWPGFIGNEATVEEYLFDLASLFRHFKRILSGVGGVALQLEDTHASLLRFDDCGFEAKVFPSPCTQEAVMPLELAKKMVESVSRPGHLVYDPFGGRGTTGLACAALGRRFIMSEIDPVHARLARSDMLHIGRNWTAQ